MGKADKFIRYCPILMWLLMFGFLLIFFAEPLKDGDIFWHIKYGEYHVQNNTLLADHSIFSWTPAIKNAPYCTWAADVLLYLLFQTGGWPLLYVFMYSCLFFPVLITWIFARKTGIPNNITTFFILMIVQLAIADASFIKPEIISLVFFVLVALLYFSLKIDRLNEKKSMFFLFFPLIFLLWANMHGVFFIGLILLGTIIAGELINYLVKCRSAFPKRSVLVLFGSGILSVAATLLTPYGTDLFEHLLGLAAKGGGMSHNVVSNTLAFQSMIDNIRMTWVQHKFELWGIMAVSFVLLFCTNIRKNRDLDFGILLPTILLSVLNLKYIRASFYWPAFWAMSLFYFASKEHLDLIGSIKKVKPFVRKGIAILILGLFIFIPIRSLYHKVYRTARYSYMGYGFNTSMPIQASAFVKENNIGNKLFNSYNAGSYLIFDLYPERKVFIDNRYFPYEEYIYDRYMAFRNGQATIEEMESEFGFDTAIITNYELVLNNFLTSKNWRPVFYGIGGIVLVNNSVPFTNDIKKLDRHRFDGIKNMEQAATIVRTAQNLNDLGTADYVIGIMKEKFLHRKSRYDFYYSICTLSQKGLRAFEKGDYSSAFECLWKVGFNDSRIRINNVLKTLVYLRVKASLEAENYREAFLLIGRLFNYYRDDQDVMYNAGVIAYQAAKHFEKTGSDIRLPSWRVVFDRLLVLYPDHPHADIAKKLLANGEIAEDPPLILSAGDKI